MTGTLCRVRALPRTAECGLAVGAAAAFRLAAAKGPLSSFELSPEQSHHLAKVLRVQAGEEVELFNGKGSVARAEVTRVVTWEYWLRQRCVLGEEMSVSRQELEVFRRNQAIFEGKWSFYHLQE